jgi:hypothetical protein
MACVPPAPIPSPAADLPPATAADTLRGIFVLEGSDPAPLAVVRSSTGRVIIDGVGASMLKLAQLDLWMRGTRTSPGRFRVAEYRVRSANGAKAWDGVLRSDPTGFRLELGDGTTHPIRGAPSTFAQLTGSRVWVTETNNGAVSEYGVL